MKSKATGCGSISTVFSGRVLLCVSSITKIIITIIMIIIIITIIMIIIMTIIIDPDTVCVYLHNTDTLWTKTQKCYSKIYKRKLTVVFALGAVYMLEVRCFT